MQNYHNNILELFNAYREYLFDEKTIVYGLPSYDYLIKKEELFYLTNTENKNILTVLSKNIRGLYNNSLFIKEQGFCKNILSYFNSEKECLNYIGGENGIISLGFDLLINYFIEEIRNARNYMKLLLENNTFDETLPEIISDDIYLNPALIDRMKVFNMEQTHYRLNIIFQNIILQYINQERNLTLIAIEKSSDDCTFKYTILISVYVSLFLIIFLFYWIPMIKELNNEIYKTKKMLSIIPVQILASQPNIKELLNISTNSD